jgi:hypothetical protein
MKIKPWIALLLLAPAFGEVTCGSTPPIKFINVMGLVFMAVLYGGGALLIREAVVHWKKGWPTLLLFGAAYGIVEEGLMCKSFFDPHWPDLNQFAYYGRDMGVNWVWAYFLTIYHALYSIGFSILVVEAFYPAVSRARWLSVRGIWWLSVLFVADVALGYAFFQEPKHPYRPGLPLTLGALAVIAVFVALGAWTRKPVLGESRRLRPVAVFGAVGFLAPIVFFLTMFSAPGSGRQPASYIAFATVLFVCFAAFTVRLSRGGAEWTERVRFAFMGGVIAGMMPLALLADASHGFALGMTLVACAEFALIVALSHRLRADASS